MCDLNLVIGYPPFENARTHLVAINRLDSPEMKTQNRPNSIIIREGTTSNELLVTYKKANKVEKANESTRKIHQQCWAQ